MWRSLRSRYTQHRDFFLLAVLVTAFDVVALALLRPGGYILEWWGYYMPHTGFVRLSDSGLYPYIHYWMEYPPLLSWLPIAAYRLGHLLPVWNHPYLWYNLAMGALLLPFKIGNLVLVYLIGLKTFDRQMALRSAIFYTALFVPLFTWLAWFDSFPLFFLLLGLYLLLAQRPLLAGVATGTGFMTKLFPLLVLPAGLRVLHPPRRKAIYYIVATILTILIIALPFLLIRADLFVASFVNMLTRPSWETVWALVDGYYSGGLVAPMEQRFDPGTASTVDHSSSLPWPAITAVFALLYIFLYTRRIDWNDKKRVLAFTGLSLSAFMLYSKGYSPQFLVYLLPFIVLLLPNWRGVATCILLTTVNYLDWPVAQLMLPSQRWLLASAVLLRTLLLIGLCVEYGLILFPASRFHRFRRIVLRGPLVITGVALVVVGGAAIGAYRAEQYSQDPYREMIDALRESGGGGIVLANESLYNRVFPYLAGTASLRLLRDEAWSLERLEALTREHEVIRVIDIGTESEQAVIPVAERWLSENCFPLGQQWFDNARLSSYVTGEVPPPHSTQARFEHQVLLVGYDLGVASLPPGEVVRITLRWQALAEIEGDYTVFIHVVAADGRIATQRDSQAGGGFRPTSSWVVGKVVTDNHALYLGPDAPPGEYRVVLGLYDPKTGQRVMLLDEDDQVQGDSLLLQTISVADDKS